MSYKITKVQAIEILDAYRALATGQNFSLPYEHRNSEDCRLELTPDRKITMISKKGIALPRSIADKIITERLIPLDLFEKGFEAYCEIIKKPIGEKT